MLTHGLNGPDWKRNNHGKLGVKISAYSFVLGDRPAGQRSVSFGRHSASRNGKHDQHGNESAVVGFNRRIQSQGIRAATGPVDRRYHQPIVILPPEQNRNDVSCGHGDI